MKFKNNKNDPKKNKLQLKDLKIIGGEIKNHL